MKIKAVVYEAEEGGYWAKVPNLPGVYTQAETLEELEANLREAIELYLSVLALLIVVSTLSLTGRSRSPS